MRYTPRSSVTLLNVLPDAWLVAVTVTPGRTPPVLSLIVPLIVASCAYARTGNASNATVKRTNRRKFISASFVKITILGAEDYIRRCNPAGTVPGCLSDHEKRMIEAAK